MAALTTWQDVAGRGLAAQLHVHSRTADPRGNMRYAVCSTAGDAGHCSHRTPAALLLLSPYLLSLHPPLLLSLHPSLPFRRWGPMIDPATHQITHNQTRAYAREACEGALKRLDTDHIDLFTLRGPIQVGG